MACLPVRSLARLRAVVAPLAPAALVHGGAVRFDRVGAARRSALGSGWRWCQLQGRGGVGISKLNIVS